MDAQSQSADNPAEVTWLQRVMNFFLVRLLIAIFFLAVAFALHLGQKTLFVKLGIADHIILKVYRPIAGTILIYLAYYLYVRWIEKRPLAELSLPGWLAELGAGAGIGFILISAQILLLTIFGVYKVEGIGFSMGIIEILGLSVIAGFIEELIMRGILFRILEEGLGSWVAIVISALVFGFAHISNEGATVMSSVAISIEAGLMLALAYMYTRRLWLVIGIHIFWNFALGGVYGLTVSGVAARGWLHGQLVGPDWVTGGVFGLEGGISAIAACVILSLFFLRRLLLANQFVPVPWSKRQGSGVPE